jgi:hypothetical protein
VSGPPPRSELTMSDLDKVIDAVAAAFTNENEPRSTAESVGLNDPPTPSGYAQSKDRWKPVFEYALDHSPEKLASLLKAIRGKASPRPKEQIDYALQEMRTRCVRRVTSASNLSLSDQIDDLASAYPPDTFQEPAERLRDTALNVRRLLMRPLLAETFLQMEKNLDFAIAEPDWVRIQPANQAVNLVTALDYLLTLMMTPDTQASKLVLSDMPGTDRAQGRTDQEASDWLTRRRLDARGTAVSEGMRLLVMLRRDIAFE